MPDARVNKYRRRITARAARNGGLDVYDLIVMYEITCPALGHALKKILLPGQRGSKSRTDDLREAAWSLAEAIQFAEDAERADDARRNAAPDGMPAPKPRSKPRSKPSLPPERPR